jgi:hypothetical protein
MESKRSIIANLLVVATIGLLVAIYYAPVWWVSLTAPNYPEEAFPDGVRIHFHMNGVFNGCKMVEKAEIQEEEALDCVHEMDTINHYVGMYPIAAGGVIERAFSPFLVSMLGVMLLGFTLRRPAVRMGVLGAGFAVIAGWMYLTYYGADGLHYQNEGYISALVTALDQDTSREEEQLSPGEALIARLKASMDEAGAPAREAETEMDKSGNIEHLRITFERDQERKSPQQRRDWDGSGAQMLMWHYEKTLGRYFNVPEEIEPMVAKMSLASHVMFWGLIGAMLLLVFGARKTGGLLYWLLVLPVLALPLLFLIDYSAWLWWYGHSLNDMGAFTVKPFMPTVFGDGKVAQFTTHSYPSVGFGLMLLASVLAGLAALIRRKQLAEQG